MSANVRVLPPMLAASDIVAQMRRAADSLESGEFGVAEAAMFVLHLEGQAEPQVFGWGRIPDRFSGIGRLYEGIRALRRE